MDVDAADLVVRNLTYRLFVELGRAPTLDEVADASDSYTADIAQTWERLHESHAIVLNAAGTGIRMANPFSGVPTRFKVRANGRSWYANCAWDSIGICAALDSDGAVLTSCPDCDDAIEFNVMNRTVSDPSLLFHALVPASQWWDDIGFT